MTPWKCAAGSLLEEHPSPGLPGVGRGSRFSSMPPGGARRLSSPTFATLRPHVSAAHAPQQSTGACRISTKTPIGNECIAQYAEVCARLRMSAPFWSPKATDRCPGCPLWPQPVPELKPLARRGLQRWAWPTSCSLRGKRRGTSPASIAVGPANRSVRTVSAPIALPRDNVAECNRLWSRSTGVSQGYWKSICKELDFQHGRWF